MDALVAIIHAGGPYAVALSVCATVVWLVAKGKLVPKTLHDQRMADKQQLVVFYENTANKALAVNEAREQTMADLTKKLTEVLTELRSR
jgi:hypothetical protein